MISRTHSLIKSPFIFILFFLSDYLKAESGTLLSANEIKNLLQAKMLLDISIPGATRASLKCDEIVDSIVSTLETFPVAQAPVSRVLQQENFHVICSSTSRIQQIIGSSTASAFFTITPPQSMHLAHPLQNYSGHHEFIHADFFFRHQTPSCPSEEIQALLPFYPPTRKNMEEYKKALDQGDARIREFEQLWLKKKNGKVLTAAEQNTFELYTKASQDCIMPIVRDVNPLSTFDNLKNNGIRSGNVMTRDHVSMKFLSIKKTKFNTIIDMVPVDPAVGIFEILKNIEKKLSGKGKGSESYQNMSPEMALIERDAYTFERLSEYAQKVFYKEARYIRDEDIEQCTGKRACSAGSK